MKRWLGAAAALVGLVSVGLAASAAHGGQDVPAGQALTAAATMGLTHALAALQALQRSFLGRWTALAFVAGATLFTGSIGLRGAEIAVPAMLTPVGGTLLMAGWLLLIASWLRRAAEVR